MKTQYLFCCLVVLLLAACGAHQRIVLMPDADGRVGKAEVRTADGTRLLSQPGDMTEVRRQAASSISTATPDYLAAAFGEAQAIEPMPPERFTLYFETGTTELKRSSLDAVSQIVSASKRRQAISIAISGHTDATGADDFNEKLARDRADFVRQLLLQRGAQFKRLTVSSHGKGNPVVPTPDGVAEPRNRRVEVVVH